MNTDTFSNNTHQKYNLPQQYGPHSFRFSSEDVKLTKDCFREGIIKAGIPFAIGTNLFTYYLAKKGWIKNPSFAIRVFSFPPQIFFGFLIFYGPVCNKRLRDRINKQLQLQNQGIGVLPEQDTSFRPSESSFDTITDTQSVDSENYFSPLNLDYESSYKPQDFDNFQDKQKVKETTYDELRQQNRENYQKQLYKLYQPRSSGFDLRSDNDSTKEELKPSGFKNKYGDDME